MQFYIQIGGEERGPISPKQLKVMADRGQIHRDDLVRKAGDTKWHPAHKLKGLFERSKKQPATHENRNEGTRTVTKPEIVDSPLPTQPMQNQGQRTPKQMTTAKVIGSCAIIFFGVAILMIGSCEEKKTPTDNTPAVRSELRGRGQSAAELQQNIQPGTGESSIDNAKVTARTPREPRQKRVELADLIERVERSVVRIDVVTEAGMVIGSGFIVSKNGTVVTNYHVVEGAVSAKATFQNGATANVSGTLLLNPEKDIAVVKIVVAGKLQPLQIAESLPRKGESVVAFGAPKGLSFSVTEGIVSAIRQSKELKRADLAGTWIQTSAPISKGNSGGPLVNLRGEVVGANTLARHDAQNLNFAISATDIRDAIEESKSKTLVALSASTNKTTNKSPSVGKAVEWYRKAAEQGDADAQYSLGLMYANGKGVAQDDVKAYTWLAVAAANGEAQAEVWLAGIRKRLSLADQAFAQQRATQLFEQINTKKK